MRLVRVEPSKYNVESPDVKVPVYCVEIIQSIIYGIRIENLL